MKSEFKLATTSGLTYWKVFRLIFLFFSLYLLGDVFYRWDGFRYYGTFSEFLPSISLVAILWSGIAVIAALLLWLMLKVYERISLHMKWEITVEHLMLFLIIFILLCSLAWFGKQNFWPYETTTYQFKRMLSLFFAMAAAFLLWMLRNKSKSWISIIQERITLLIWMFGIFVFLSFPIVVYHAWVNTKEISARNHIETTTGSDRKNPNIILVSFDALTARDMSVYGYHRQTTPFINEWAKNAFVFTRLEAASNYTAPTTATIMTGKRVWTHQLYQSHGFKPDKSAIENLPLVMKNNGYYNMAFVVNPIASVKSLGIDESFDLAFSPSKFNDPVTLYGIVNKFLYQAFGESIRLYDWIISNKFIMGKVIYKVSNSYSTTSKTEVPPEIAFNSLLDALDNNPPEPYFAWVHIYPPHDPYLPPAPYMGMFDSSPELMNVKDQEKIYRFKYQEYPDTLQPTIDILRARYDEFIKYSDNEFRHFMHGLSVRDGFKNTIIIFSSDHGESFEHNYLMHGYSHLYEQVTHIPLIIKLPDQSEQKIVNALAEQIDVPATILDLVQLPIPSWMEGRSLVPLMRGDELPEEAIFSMNFERNPSRGSEITKGSIAVWKGDYKLIYYLDDKQSLLFNLKQDPDELNNLFDKEREIGKRLLGLIQDNLKRANERIIRERQGK